jgi:hypothetical protein
MAVASSSMLAPRAALMLLATASASASPSGSPEKSQQQLQQLPTDQYFDEYGSLYDHIGMLQVRDFCACRGSLS